MSETPQNNARDVRISGVSDCTITILDAERVIVEGSTRCIINVGSPAAAPPTEPQA